MSLFLENCKFPMKGGQENTSEPEKRAVVPPCRSPILPKLDYCNLPHPSRYSFAQGGCFTSHLALADSQTFMQRYVSSDKSGFSDRPNIEDNQIQNQGTDLCKAKEVSKSNRRGPSLFLSSALLSTNSRSHSAEAED